MSYGKGLCFLSKAYAEPFAKLLCPIAASAFFLFANPGCNVRRGFFCVLCHKTAHAVGINGKIRVFKRFEYGVFKLRFVCRKTRQGFYKLPRRYRLFVRYVRKNRFNMGINLVLPVPAGVGADKTQGAGSYI